MPAALDSPSRNASGATDRFDAIARLPFGYIGVRTDEAQVTEICFLHGAVPRRAAANARRQRGVGRPSAYGVDSSAPMVWPLAVEGTDFQRRGWEQIACIPAGSTATYGEVARRLTAEARAVGQACGDNRPPL